MWAWKSVLLGTVMVASTAGAVTPAEDEVSIRNLQTNQSMAWNDHDAPAYANLFADDGEVVTLLGWWWKGRRQIQEKVATAFDVAYRESIFTVTDISVRLLSSSIAVAHVRWTMTGSKVPPGLPEPKEGIQIQVLQKKAGTWLIQSLQNTPSFPEHAYPHGAAASNRRP